MIRGILFDVDGVLIDSEETIAQACIEFFKRRGVHAVPADFAPFIGAGENRFIGGVAEKYGFAYSGLSMNDQKKLEEYSHLIIQTTPVGMGAKEEDEGADPIEFYGFGGTEQVYDIIYYPEKTPLLCRAEKAGCRIQNGYSMLIYQAEKQFELFTGEKYG